MPCVLAPRVFVAVSAATATGLLTMSSNGLLLPGTRGWLCKDDGSARALVKIVTIVGTTQCTAMKYANNDLNSPPSYGLSDLSAFNASSHLSIDEQPVYSNPLFSTPVY